MASDEWTLVSRGSKRRQRQHTPKASRHPSALSEPLDTTARVSRAKEDALFGRISDISRALRDDSLVIDALQELAAHYKWTPTDSSQATERVLHVVCYGLGSFCSSSNAVHQLAYAHALTQCITREHAHVSCIASVFDPVMNESDRLLAQRLGFSVIEHNERGRRAVADDTLFFMPHCGQALYQNVLLANWDAERLQRLTIIGNSFTAYSDRVLDRSARERSLLVRVAPFAHETALRSCVPRTHDAFALYEAAFNDTSVHAFTFEQATAATENEALKQLSRRLVEDAAADDARDDELIITSS
ncbi:hypothetical protein PINS_up013817 [Pythium insidiosum]|nr:hypothetical protein PINS_up013817 [Pythium insidiosum]